MECFVRRIICFFSFGVLIFSIASCVILPLEYKKYDVAPENFITPDLKSTVKFYYSKEKLNLDSENILIYGKFSFPYYKNTDKTVLSYESEKRKWNFDIKNSEFSINGSADFLIFFNNVEEICEYSVQNCYFYDFKIEFPYRVNEKTVPSEFMIAKLTDKEGKEYKVFSKAIKKDMKSTSRDIIMNKKQEFFILNENMLIAEFSKDYAKIYSDVDFSLKRYISVLNAIFDGIRVYEKKIIF